ncbi:MAG: hypothetical protein GY802_06735 [Gammaproteobacteria bacterium]|nr:hypothetical protein [Gammaproteobacteria bacterium]
MRLNFRITETKRSVLFYSAIIFLLQCLAPAFQGVMAKSANGYSDTLCTMYGPVTVFVKLEDGEPGDKPNCYECSVCIIQANLNAEPVSHDLQLETRYRLDPNSSSGPLYQIANPPLFPSFLSRAPPA